MADAFRGLTLRIGADARPLQSAISSITRSAAQAQKQMNRLNKALKFDGTDVKSMGHKIDLMGDKAMHSARAISKIKTAMQQAVAESKDFDLKRVAEQTKDAYSATERLRAEYNHVDAELQHIYDAVARAAKKMEKFKTIEEAVEYVKMLKEAMHGTGEAAEWAKQEFDRFLKKASETSKINEKFGQQKGEVEKLSNTLDKLIDRHKKINAEYDKMNTVQGYRAMTMEARVYEAEVRQAASETARLRSEMFALGTGGSLSKSVSKINSLNMANDKAVASAHQMIDAYRKLPSSLERLKDKVTAVATAEATLKAKSEAIKDALRKIEEDPAFDKLAASSEEAYLSAAKVENKYQLLATKLSLAEGEADQLRMTLNTLDDANADKLSSEYKEVERQLEKTEDRARHLRTALASLDDKHATASLITEQRRLKTALAENEMQAQQLHTQMSKLTAMGTAGKSLRQFGFGMYASLTPAAMMAGRYMIQSAEDIDAAYRDMRKTVNGTEEEFQHLLDSAIAFSTTHVTTADQILEIEAMGGQLGIQVDSLESFAHTVANLDIATNMQADDISEQLGKMATVMGMSEDEYDNFGDALVRLGNNMPVMENDIMNLTNRFMGMAKVVGMSPDQMLGWAAAASATGQKAEAAGSSMMRFISNMETAVNGSDEDLQKWADVAGMTAQEFRKSFGEDASGTMYRFVQGLGEIQKSGGSVNQVLKDLGINNVRDKQLLEGLANQMANGSSEANVLANALQMSNDAWNGMPTNVNGRIERAGDAMREAEKKSEGFSGSVQKLRNQATALMNELAEGAQPIVSALANQFGGITNKLRNASSGMKTLAVGVGIAAAAIGPATVGLGTFMQSAEVIGKKASPAIQKGLVKANGVIQKTADAVFDLGGKMTRGGSAVQKLGLALSGLSAGPVIAAIAAITAALTLAVVGVQDYVKHMHNFKAATEGTVDVAQRFASLNRAAAGDLEDYSGQAEHTAKTVNQLSDSIAEMVEAQNARADAAEAEIGKLSAAQQIIEQYANTDLSGNIEAQGKLRAAVDIVNDACGTQIQVIDAVNGKLSDEAGQLDTTTAALSAYIEEKKQSIRLEAMTDTLTEMYQERAEAVNTWVTDQRKADDYYREHKNEIENPMLDAGKAALEYELLTQNAERSLSVVQSVDDGINSLESDIGDLVTSMDKANASIYDMAKGNDILMETFNGNDKEFEEFATSLDNAGITMDEFCNLSAKEMGDLVTEWSRNGHDMEAALDSIGLHARSLSELYQAEIENATGSTESWQAALDATGLSSEELAKALQSSGVSAIEFSRIGGEAFGKLYNAANGDIPKVMAMLDLLNDAGIDPKEVEITTDEDGIDYINDQVFSLNENVARIGDRTFELNAEGNWEEIPEVLSESEEMFDEYGEYIDDYTENMEEASDATSQLAAMNEDLVSQLNKSGRSADEFCNFLNTMGYSMEDLANMSPALQYTMVDAFNAVATAADTCGVDTQEMMDKVASSGISFDTLAKIGGDAFARIYEAADGNMDLVIAMIDEYNSLPFSDKKNYLKSDSSDATGKVDAVNKKSMPDKRNYLRASDYATSVINAVNRMRLGDHTTHLYAVDHASWTIGNVAARIASLPTSRTISLWASGGIFGHASGGIAIPRHGDGGFSVATGPTLTPAGWVGEDGWEAIVPLTNRRYVRPFAQAVASEVRLPSSGTTFNITVNASGDGEDIARALRREMTAWLMTQKAGA